MDNFKDGIVLQIQLNERDLSKYEIDLDKVVLNLCKQKQSINFKKNRNNGRRRKKEV